MRILIAGCGWLGRATGAWLHAKGHEVLGVRRQLDPTLTNDGVTPLACDLTDPAQVEALPDGFDAIVACQAAGSPDLAAYQRAYLRANEHLLAAAKARGIARVVVVGSTAVFGQTDGEVVDEATPVQPTTDGARVLVEMEGLVRGAGGHVVRLSGLYGPGRVGVVDRVSSGALALGPGDDTWMNWCHRDDAAALLGTLVESGRPGDTWHGSDAQPLTRRDLVAWVASTWGFTPTRRPEGTPARLGRGGANRRVSAASTFHELGLQWRYPSIQAGLTSLVQPLRRT